MCGRWGRQGFSAGGRARAFSPIGTSGRRSYKALTRHGVLVCYTHVNTVQYICCARMSSLACRSGLATSGHTWNSLPGQSSEGTVLDDFSNHDLRQCMYPLGRDDDIIARFSRNRRFSDALLDSVDLNSEHTPPLGSPSSRSSEEGLTSSRSMYTDRNCVENGSPFQLDRPDKPHLIIMAAFGDRIWSLSQESTLDSPIRAGTRARPSHSIQDHRTN